MRDRRALVDLSEKQMRLILVRREIDRPAQLVGRVAIAALANQRPTVCQMKQGGLPLIAL